MYDGEDRQIPSTLNSETTTYGYDADGRRVKKGTPGARVDIPKGDNRPKHETIHFNDPDKQK